jgi:hypothetical protein
MADKVLLIAACHHSITVTQVRRYTLQAKQFVIHKRDEYSSKNKLSIIATEWL